jgi:hypothetical protein
MGHTLLSPKQLEESVTTSISLRPTDGRARARLAKLRLELAKSVLGTLDFEQEKGVCDFLVDAIMADFDFLQKLKAIFTFCTLDKGMHGRDLERVSSNIAALVYLPLPGRDNTTVLQVAKNEANLRVREVLSEMAVLGIAVGIIPKTCMPVSNSVLNIFKDLHEKQAALTKKLADSVHVDIMGLHKGAGETA